ncbi:DUF5017 domain-containing protein [Mucilaginibacter sp. PAMB04168]|uniref:DUF5017 domain-containing protein n=1 Tax=Mucilaginibacter sp. PAMB04168 TaxID=3138567 RepID=UPI0031F6868E
MSRTLYITLFMLATVFASCQKDLSTGDTDFTVSVDKSTLALGDTARFRFNGNPDIVTFYSGEAGKRFEYSGRATADGTPVLTFNSVRASGTQPNSLQLMVSTDFKGVAKGDTVTTKANIAAATWTDITSRATLSSGSTSATPSGAINLSDFASAGKPVFFAFKYNAAAGTIQNRWTITSFSIKNELSDGTTYEIANLNSSTTPYQIYGVDTFSPGWAGYTLQNTYLWNITSTQLMITGATTAATAKETAEAWAIIGSINLRKVVPDVGVLIKNPTQSLSASAFTYKYAAKGSFNAVFVGGSIDVNREKFVQKSVKVNVN